MFFLRMLPQITNMKKNVPVLKETTATRLLFIENGEIPVEEILVEFDIRLYKGEEITRNNGFSLSAKKRFFDQISNILLYIIFISA